MLLITLDGKRVGLFVIILVGEEEGAFDSERDGSSVVISLGEELGSFEKVAVGEEDGSRFMLGI